MLQNNLRKLNLGFHQASSINVATKCAAAFLLIFLWGAFGVEAQTTGPTQKTDAAPAVESTDEKVDSAENKKKDLSHLKYRLLQSHGLLVETAYHQEEGELQHAVSFSRSNRRTWATAFSEEIPLGSGKHQLGFEMPTQFFKGEHGYRGAGDAKLEYSYMLVGSNTSNVTVSPGFGLTLPTGDWRKELGNGAPGISLKLPVSVMLGKRFTSHTNFEATYTRKAKNSEGERANLMDFEIGHSLVWYAKPKLNFLFETVWERGQEVVGDRSAHSERAFYVSPGVRWAHRIKSVLLVPSVGVPVGFGPSRGERGIVFSIAFEHSIKKERE